MYLCPGTGYAEDPQQDECLWGKMIESGPRCRLCERRRRRFRQGLPPDMDVPKGRPDLNWDNHPWGKM